MLHTHCTDSSQSLLLPWICPDIPVMVDRALKLELYLYLEFALPYLSWLTGCKNSNDISLPYLEEDEPVEGDAKGDDEEDVGQGPSDEEDEVDDGGEVNGRTASSLGPHPGPVPCIQCGQRPQSSYRNLEVSRVGRPWHGVGCLECDLSDTKWDFLIGCASSNTSSNKKKKWKPCNIWIKK